MNGVNNQAARPYHHGRLREEMVRIAIGMAAEGGPEAIGVREVARRSGVSPSAAYRHFDGQEGLLAAVRECVLRDLHAAMDRELERAGRHAPARDRIRAAGRGYFAFATGHPQLFRCLSSGFTLPDRQDPGDAASDPFDLLMALIGEHDGADGRGSSRPDGEVREDAVALWAAVHGLSVLCTAGALRGLDPGPRDRLLEHTLAVAVAGLDGAV